MLNIICLDQWQWGLHSLPYQKVVEAWIEDGWVQSGGAQLILWVHPSTPADLNNFYSTSQKYSGRKKFDNNHHEFLVDDHFSDN